MATLKERTADGLTGLIMSGLLLTPVLVLTKAATPLPIPWAAAFIPWLGVFHLLLCWFAAQIIARLFWDLAGLLS